jgi:hypothetical protein
MSYDLFFRMPSGMSSLSQAEFEPYFRGRRNYTLEGARALYRNDNTGVYFTFEFGAQDADSDGQQTMAPVVFNLNYFRPHIFGLEADPEVAAFVGHFSLSVMDPQTSGMGSGAYSREGFLRGWNEGNEMGYRSSLLGGGDRGLKTLPTDKIEACWRWNFAKDNLQKAVGDQVLVPRVEMLAVGGEIRPGVVWPDAVPILLPEVDLVAVHRNELAPRSLIIGKKRDTRLVPWERLAPLLAGFRKGTMGLKCHKLDYATRPQPVEDFVRKIDTPPSKVESVPVDQVLNREMVEPRGPTVR